MTDARAAEPEDGDERALLLGWLRFHRDALAAKCAGMTAAQLVEQSAPPSTLSLLGLVRHLTEMECHYLGHALSGDGRAFAYCTEDDDEPTSRISTSQWPRRPDPRADRRAPRRVAAQNS